MHVWLRRLQQSCGSALVVSYSWWSYLGPWNVEIRRSHQLPGKFRPFDRALIWASERVTLERFIITFPVRFLFALVDCGDVTNGGVKFWITYVGRMRRVNNSVANLSWQEVSIWHVCHVYDTIFICVARLRTAISIGAKFILVCEVVAGNMI